VWNPKLSCLRGGCDWSDGEWRSRRRALKLVDEVCSFDDHDKGESAFIINYADAGQLNCFTQLSALLVLRDRGNGRLPLRSFVRSCRSFVGSFRSLIGSFRPFARPYLSFERSCRPFDGSFQTCRNSSSYFHNSRTVHLLPLRGHSGMYPLTIARAEPVLCKIVSVLR
jgi:hypothetical protein